MSIAELGSIGEFIGSVAVLITLVYLAVQVRQNNQHVRAQMGHQGWVSTAEYELASMSGVAADALSKAQLDADSLTDKDLKVLDAYFRTVLQHMGRVEHMNAQGLEIYSTEQTAIGFVDLFNDPIGKAWWQANKSIVDTLAPNVGVRIEELFDEPDTSSRAASFRAFHQLTQRPEA